MIQSTKILLTAGVVGLAILLLLLTAYPVLSAGPASGVVQEPSSSGKLQVLTSFRPITLLVRPVAGKYADVTELLPPGAEPHEYEPTPDNAITLARGKILFYDSPAMEPWAEQLAESANPNIVQVSFESTIPPSELARMKNTSPDFPDITQDPHLWLSPPLAGYFVSSVAVGARSIYR